jgi:predicted RNase H-like HicB family nuclease
MLTMKLTYEADGRWIAEVPELPGVLAYGATRKETRAKAEALAIRVVADRIAHQESVANTH